MKKRFYSIIFLLIIGFLPGRGFAHEESEEIIKFESKIQISKEGAVTTTEYITYDFGSENRHGIFRDIQTVFENTQGKKFKNEVRVLSVKDEEGQNLRFEILRNNKSLSVKIGDPDKYISGIKTFIIQYETIGALQSYSDYDELYWNVTGERWEVPIDQSTASVSFEGTTPSNLKAVCFTGVLGSKDQKCSYNLQEGTVELSTTARLYPGEGFTVAVSFDKGLVKIPNKGLLLDPLRKIFLVIWYFVIPLGVVFIYIRFGRDPKTNTAIPALFEVPKVDGKRFTPAQAGTTIDETADNKDITATLVDLAIRGHLTIKQEKKDYLLIKNETQPKDKNTLQAFEETLLEALFKNGKQTSTKNLKDDFYETSEDIKNKLYQNVVDLGMFPSNPKTIRTIWIVLGFASFVTANIILGAACLLFAKAMPRKTFKGARVQIDILGLKKFLGSQERQLEFQEKNWFLFERLLPYAIAFGVTQTWAERFKDLGTMPETSWFISSRPFDSHLFASSLNGFDSSIANIATQTHSSQGFSSGFGGGGFSGGGFGGGGGGRSW